MATISERISADLKAAMKAKDSQRLQTLRLLSSALRYRRIDKLSDLTPDDELDVLRKQMKQRDDAIELYVRGGREELADQERREQAVIAEYLPRSMSADEVRLEVRRIVKSLPAGTKFGDVMKAAMGELKDRASGKVVQEIVREETAAAS